MSLMLKQYSSGFRSIHGLQDQSDLIGVKIENARSGDAELVDLLKLIQINRLSNISSQHKLQFIDIAKRLFNEFDRFIDYNIANNNLVHGKYLDFIIDTVEFINGGIRSMDIHFWLNYLDFETKKASPTDKPRVVELNLTGANYIGKWLRQPNGFEDLVATLTILFGVRLKDTTKPTNGLI